jgi:hypothetical protein
MKPLLLWKRYKYYIFLCVCSLSYQSRKGHEPYYIVICVLAGSTTFFHIISQVARFSGGGGGNNIKCVQMFYTTFA